MAKTKKIGYEALVDEIDKTFKEVVSGLRGVIRSKAFKELSPEDQKVFLGMKVVKSFENAGKRLQNMKEPE